jgi:hypothetical protein
MAEVHHAFINEYQKYFLKSSSSRESSQSTEKSLSFKTFSEYHKELETTPIELLNLGLHQAILEGRLDTAEMLISYGANAVQLDKTKTYKMTFEDMSTLMNYAPEGMLELVTFCYPDMLANMYY